MEQPNGFRKKGKEDYVFKLVKSLYGLKQAPRQLYQKLNSVMIEHGYKMTKADHCVFLWNFSKGDFIIILLYVYHMLIVGNDVLRIKELNNTLSESFAMKDLGEARKILDSKSMELKKIQTDDNGSDMSMKVFLREKKNSSKDIAGDVSEDRDFDENEDVNVVVSQKSVSKYFTEDIIELGNNSEDGNAKVSHNVNEDVNNNEDVVEEVDEIISEDVNDDANEISSDDNLNETFTIRKSPRKK
ncbi:uncharacterized protein LOC127138136 [Lathyrus oleraceus]|uniref:uncharacterized protein LOC127138136 n=1 Tax=Pisum sativum TaxID=3888 RepID=UPI0021CFA6B2|nr:uncharacterized protein LOC127138136 [Pisum sativum]